MTEPTPDALRRQLRTWCARASNQFHRAAIDLLDDTGLLDHPEVRAHIEVATITDRQGHSTTIAWIKWSTLPRFQQTGPFGSIYDRLVPLAVSIAHGTPVNLQAVLPGLGHHHARAVLAAVARALGIADDVDITDAPSYVAAEQGRRQALSRLLADNARSADEQRPTYLSPLHPEHIAPQV
ncbi:hypothetical protein ACWZHB_07130 [Nocardia sp. FBN12]|uniref:hypothetical protein n=1 Tax=Nocardia sp. FBN12 TaxID=3419766 RepID=UPI003CFFF02D